MSDWQYVISRLSGAGTETVLDWDVPLGGVVLSSALSGPDSMSGVISPELATLKASDGRALITPWASALYAVKDDRVRLGCIVTDLRARDNALTIDGVGFSGYLQGMPYNGSDKDFGGQDPLSVVEWAWAEAQRHPRGNIGMRVENKATPIRLASKAQAEADSGRKSVQVSWQTTHDLGKLVDELAAFTPFDYREDHTFSGNTIQHHLRIGYPKLGARLTNLRFVVGENVIVMPDSIDEGSDYASEVLVIGAGEGKKMQRYWVPRMNETRLRRPVVVSDKSLRSPGMLQHRAKQELSLRLGLPEIAEIKVIDHPNAPLGSVSPGDDIFLQTGPEGWQGDLGFWARVLEVTVRPDEPGSITLSLARVEGV